MDAIDTNLLWGILTLICSAISAAGGAAARAYGEKMKVVAAAQAAEAEERKQERARQISEQDLWHRMGGMDQRLNDVTERLEASLQREGALQRELAATQTELKVPSVLLHGPVGPLRPAPREPRRPPGRRSRKGGPARRGGAGEGSGDMNYLLLTKT